MTTATTTDVRAWARARGIDISAHGRIPGEIQAQYDAEHQTTADWPAAHVPGDPDTLTPDYDYGVTEADFITADDPPEDAPVGHPAEVRPRRVRAPKTGAGVIARWRKPKGGTKTARPGKKFPRVSLAGLIEDAWSQLAWAAAPIPPMQRLLYAQAPFAGIALEGALKDTMVDRVLQPVARAEEKAKAVGGLVMPPVALMAVLASAPQPTEVEVRDEAGNVTLALQWPEPSFAHKTALVNFRWSLMLMAEVGNIHLEEYKAKAEAAARRGDEADAFMAWILGVDQPGERPVREEEEAVKRAQAMFGGEQA